MELRVRWTINRLRDGKSMFSLMSFRVECQPSAWIAISGMQISTLAKTVLNQGVICKRNEDVT